MRVITGKAKGRPLKSVKGRLVRPTSDRVKESLFNVLGSRVFEADFLDLFAGSGAVGIEALSRGARKCLFVEIQTEHLQVVMENLTLTGLTEWAELLRRDARGAANDLGRRGLKFDIIFADPPYGQDLLPGVLTAIVTQTLLRSNGMVICEHHKKDLVPPAVCGQTRAGALTKVRELFFGETVLSLYKETASADLSS